MKMNTSQNLRPKKSLGQNFLTSIPAKIKIIGAGNISVTDTILEIGPGKGAITEGLLSTGAKIIAVEKDTELVSFLENKFANEIKTGQLKLINDDALNFKFSNYRLQATSYKLIANIPYYITGAIFEYYLSNENQPTHMVVLIQKEVANRIVAHDNKHSILSLAVHVYGTPKIVAKVSRGSFFPIPNVDSAILSISNISRKNFKNKKHEENFFQMVKSGFAHKRKFLISNLKEKIPSVAWQELFIKNCLNEKVRAEDVTLEKWLAISAQI